MEGNTQKVESYDRIQSQYQQEIMELLKTDPRLQATEEGMARAVDIIGEGYYHAVHGLAQSLTMDAARIYQEKRARDGLEPAQLGSTTLSRVEDRAQRILDTTIDQLRQTSPNSLELGAKLPELAGPEIDSQLQSIAMDELAATNERPSDNLAATIAMEDTLTRMNAKQSLRGPGQEPATPKELREAATRIVADSRGKIDRMKWDMDLDLRQGPGGRKIAEWAMNNEGVKRAIHNDISNAIKIDELSGEPDPNQDLLIQNQIRDSLQSAVGSGEHEGAPEAGTHPFTTPEYDTAAWMVVDYNPEVVERAVEEGQIEASEERNDWWHTSLEYGEQIEGLPERWTKVNDYLYTGEQGYTIVDPEGVAAYEYRASDGYSRWHGEEWSPAAKGEDPVQQIKDRLEQAEQGKVNALVQVTHAPEAAAGTDMQGGAMTQEAMAGHLRKRETKEAIQL